MIGILDWIIIGIFAGFCGIDLVYRARKFDRTPNWKMIGLISFVAYSAIGTYAPFLWDDAIGRLTLINAAAFSLPVQITGGFLIVQLGGYFWHRAMHAVPFLWRWVHQMHHSAERVDIFGAYFFHPLDMAGWALVGSVTLVGIFGISPAAAAPIIISLSFFSMFQHANIRTPHWLGYIIARPESHAVHHQRGVHAYNYCDLPIIDMLFGTFRNPKEWNHKSGLFDGSARRLMPLLLGRELG